MNVIKFNLEELKNNLNGFSCYIIGRSYDLEENSDFNESDLDNIKIINDEKIGISVLDKHEYVIEKEPVYSSDDDCIFLKKNQSDIKMF